MKKHIYTINQQGFIDRTLLGLFDEKGNLISPLGDFVTTDLPQPLPFYKPRWNGTDWVEGATPEEIEEMTKVDPSPPTQEERLRAVEETMNFLLGL